MKPQQEIKYFNETGHFTHETIAMCAEKMIDLRLHKNLPDEVFVHLQSCVACGNHVAGLYSTISSRPEIVREITKNLRKRELKKHRPFSRNSVFLYIAASVVILLTLSVAGYFYMKPKSPEALFQQHFYAYQNILTTKSSTNSELMRAMLYYELEDYEGAQPLFQNVLAHEPHNYAAMFYYANANLVTGKTEQAISLLEQCITSEHPFREVAQWYLALAYLRQAEIQKARSLLLNLKATGDFYGTKAGELLSELPGK